MLGYIQLYDSQPYALDKHPLIPACLIRQGFVMEYTNTIRASELMLIVQLSWVMKRINIY